MLGVIHSLPLMFAIKPRKSEVVKALSSLRDYKWMSIQFYCSLV